MMFILMMQEFFSILFFLFIYFERLHLTSLGRPSANPPVTKYEMLMSKYSSSVTPPNGTTILLPLGCSRLSTVLLV